MVNYCCNLQRTTIALPFQNRIVPMGERGESKDFWIVSDFEMYYTAVVIKCHCNGLKIETHPHGQRVPLSSTPKTIIT